MTEVVWQGDNDMKLNMWMIVNRLRVLEPELHLSDEDPADIKGVRLYSVDNCAYVYQKEKDVICCYGSEYFVLPGISLEVAFGMIQDVFDFYQSWEDQIWTWARYMDLQKIVDSCYPMLGNPLVLLDGNYKVLAMSRQYEAGDVDGEWKYLAENGYSSIKAVRQLRARSAMINRERQRDPHAMLRLKLDVFGYVNVSRSIYFQNDICGRAVLMEKERAVNKGDILLLCHLTELVAPYISKMNFSSSYNWGSSVFSRLIQNEDVNRDDLEMQMKYYGWKADDTYRMLMISYREKEADDMLVRLLRSALLQSAPTCVIEVHAKRIILILNTRQQEAGAILEKIEDVIIRNDTDCYVSLESESILHLPYLYHQLAEMDKIIRKSSVENFYYFDQCAVQYILRCTDADRKWMSIYPPIRQYYETAGETGRENLEILRVYLKNNESVQAAARELFFHRNTLVYRLKKIESRLSLDLENAERCFYYLISLELLEALHEHREPEEE